MHIYEVRPRKDHRGLLRKASPNPRLHFGFCLNQSRLRPAQKVKVYSRSHHTIIRVYDPAGNVIEAHEHKGDFKEW